MPHDGTGSFYLLLFHDISLIKLINYQSECCIRNTIKLNWRGHYKKIILMSKGSLIHNFKRKYCYFQVFYLVLSYQNRLK